jgi:hypothetical protein
MGPNLTMEARVDLVKGATLYAQLIRGTRTAEGQQAGPTACELIAALERRSGFSGALCFADHGSGDSMMIAFWKKVDQAHRPLERCHAPFLETVSVWEVNVRV